MADYFTEAELEAVMMMAFTATSTPTTTQIGVLATEISNMFDALMQQAVGSETPDEYVTQACIGCAVYTVGQRIAGEPIDPEKQADLLKRFMTPIKQTMLYYEQKYPGTDGQW